VLFPRNTTPTNPTGDTVTRNASRCLALWLALLILAAPLARPALAQDAPPQTGATGAGVAADSGAEPDRVTTPLNPAPGIYYLDYGTSYNPATYPIDGGMSVFGWSAFNSADGVYDWTPLDNRISQRKGSNLKIGLMTTVYDGTGAGDIRSTPNFVIKTPNAVLPATSKTCATCAESPHYIDYFRKYNGALDSGVNWTIESGANITIGTGAPADPDGIANGSAAKLGGVNNAKGYLHHNDMRVPAMPPSLDGTVRVTIEARVYIDTADTGANDHLYFELWNTSNQKLAGIDIDNLEHANKTWRTYSIDVSGFAPERSVRVAFKVAGNSSNITTFWVDTVKLRVRHLIPNYHNPAFYDAYTKFIAAFGARYKDNPDLQFVSYGTGVYGENIPVQASAYPDTHFNHVVQNAGLTSALWTDYINRVTQAQADAFTTVPGQAPNRSQMVQMAPIFLLNQEREDVTDYAGARKVGVSANFLSPDWTQALKNDGTGVYDPFIKFGGQVPLAMEGYDSDLCNPVLSWLGFALALDMKVDYLRVDSGLFRNADGSLSLDAPGLDWAQNYIGRTAQTTPRAWVIMREHRNPTMTTCRSGGVVYYDASLGGSPWPVFGNFEFYLRQVDSIAGGKSVAETNDKGVDSRYAKNPTTGAVRPEAGLGNCPARSYREDLFGPNYPCFKEPYNPDLPPLVGQNPDDYTDFYNPADWTGAGKEAYTVRRTDQANSNPFMFFLIENGYIPGDQTYSATITVKYFDIGSDRWSLKYDATSGEKTAGTITKGGTRALKTATFAVTDGRFGGRLTGGADFYIDSRNGTTNDGNEWIHMVEIERTSTLTTPNAPVVAAAAAGLDLALTWPAVTQDTGGKSAVVDHYDVWRSTANPYHAPNPTSDTPHARVLGAGFTELNARSTPGGAYYTVTAVSAAPSALSNRVGVFGFALTGGR
jgi:hypothetical protein